MRTGPAPDPSPAPPITDDDRRALLVLARQTLASLLGVGPPPDAVRASAALDAPRATFVTLRRRGTHELCGCRGEIQAVRPLAHSVAHMAVASATTDPRFPPVRAEELAGLHIEISALTPMRRIQPEDVQVGRDGLYIVHGGCSGLLLPQVPVEQGWDRETYLRWICRKAGLPDVAWRSEGAELYAFEAEVWGEAE